MPTSRTGSADDSSLMITAYDENEDLGASHCIADQDADFGESGDEEELEEECVLVHDKTV